MQTSLSPVDLGNQSHQGCPTFLASWTGLILENILQTVLKGVANKHDEITSFRPGTEWPADRWLGTSDFLFVSIGGNENVIGNLR